MPAPQRTTDTARPGNQRPNDLDRPIAVGNRTMTLAERLIEVAGQGATDVQACNRVGIHRQTLDLWERNAANAQRRIAARYGDQYDGTDPDQIATPKEHRIIDFLTSYYAARARYVAGLEANVLRLASGGIDREVVTEKYERVVTADGEETLVLVERSSKRDRTLPNLRALERLLVAAEPEKYGARAQQLADGASVPDTDAAAQSLAEAAQAFLQGVQAGQEASGG